ncbi:MULTISPECIES: hypothetical protein [unclassified Microcoleus]|uniref:hypothetical protein n=1 Tax=unclassified Microcoleus TaxID=2642155 RepID=UPI0025FF133D|nr:MULTISPECIES: hypothetical protein [unclassified Microcoleus]
MGLQGVTGAIARVGRSGVQGDRPMQQNGSTINDISIQSDALSGHRAALSARLETGKILVPQKKGFF